MEKIQKRTKIVATLGPASRDPEIIRSLILSGANVFRLNFSHGTPKEHGETIAAVRKIAADLKQHIAVLQDLPGPKVRTGKLADGQATVTLERGAPFALTTEDVPGSAQRVSVSYRDLPADVAVGTRVYLQDGAITLRILDKTATEVFTTVEVGGDLRPQQGINYPGRHPQYRRRLRSRSRLSRIRPGEKRRLRRRFVRAQRRGRASRQSSSFTKRVKPRTSLRRSKSTRPSTTSRTSWPPPTASWSRGAISVSRFRSNASR